MTQVADFGVENGPWEAEVADLEVQHGPWDQVGGWKPAPGRHRGGTKEAPRRHQGGTKEAPRNELAVGRGPRADNICELEMKIEKNNSNRK